MAENRIRIAVLGASGYGGGELVRLLLDHPNADLVFLSSRRNAGVPVARALPAVRNHPASARLRLRTLEELPAVDIAFGCLPAGGLPAVLDMVTARARYVVNLAGDFRLADSDQARTHYPASGEWTERFEYHVPELSKPPTGPLLNLPGCMAVAAVYALHPLVSGQLVDPYVVVDAKTGSSGGGHRAGTEHAERAGNAQVHKAHGHRHAPEIAQALGALSGAAPRLQFSTYSLDTARGVLLSAYTTLRPGVDERTVRREYARAYGSTPFVRLRGAGGSSGPSLPMLKSVVGSNVAEVAAQVRDDRCVTVVALDNLVKGAAGQAVQTMNQLFGLPESTGLPFTSVAP